MLTLNRTPPGPKERFPGDTLLALRRDPTGTLERIARNCGDVAAFTVGTQAVWVVSHPDLVGQVLTSHRVFEKAATRANLPHKLLAQGVLRTEGEQHMRQRRLMQPAFHRDRIATYAQVMIDEAERFSDTLQNGQAVAMHEAMMAATLSVVGRTLFGSDVAATADVVAESLEQLMAVANMVRSPFAGLLMKLNLPLAARIGRARDRLDAVVTRIAESHRVQGDTGDLLSMLLDSGLEERELLDNLLTIFLAGHETTANALTWTWYLLSRHREVAQRLHQELDAVLEGPPRPEDFPRLTYTRQVLTESMRLYPPAWTVARRALEDVPLGDYLLPKDTVVLPSQWVVHHDARWYPHPYRFDPDRDWSTVPKHAYFPFGGGNRICIGEQFAWMESVLMFAAIARRWDFELDARARVEVQPLVTLRPRHGMPMFAHRRG